MSLLRFFWIRHAPPVNPDDLCYGQADIGVDVSNDSAFASQARKLPAHALWVASPLTRTVQTAQKLAQFHDNAQSIVLATDHRLIEQSFGRWEQLNRTAMRADPGFAPYSADPEHIAPPGGESLIDLAARVTPAIDALIAAHPKGGDIVLVAHGGTIRAALHHATGLMMQDTLKLGVSPLSLTEIHYDPARLRHHRNPWTLEGLNIKP